MVAVVLLAAGASSRMRFPKQLPPYDGRPLVRRSAEAALATGCEPVLVVVGAHAEEVRAVLDGLPVTVVENKDWEDGIGSSIRAGVGALPPSAAAVVLMLADQPLVTTGSIDRLVAEFRATGHPIVASAYSGTVGVPVLFARDRFPDLLSLAPSQGCKELILHANPSAATIPCPEAAVDIDTPTGYEAASRR